MRYSCLRSLIWLWLGCSVRVARDGRAAQVLCDVVLASGNAGSPPSSSKSHWMSSPTCISLHGLKMPVSHQPEAISRYQIEYPYRQNISISSYIFILSPPSRITASIRPYTAPGYYTIAVQQSAGRTLHDSPYEGHIRVKSPRKIPVNR